MSVMSDCVSLRGVIASCGAETVCQLCCGQALRTPVLKHAYDVSNDVIRLVSKSRSPVDLPPDNACTYGQSRVEVQQTCQLEVSIIWLLHI